MPNELALMQHDASGTIISAICFDLLRDQHWAIRKLERGLDVAHALASRQQRTMISQCAASLASRVAS
jgi:hypothetical protein